MTVRVVTPDGVAFETEISYANIPVPGGSVGILNNHAPMLCAAEAGTARFTLVDGSTVTKTIGKGAAHICNNEIILLVDTAE